MFRSHTHTRSPMGKPASETSGSVPYRKFCFLSREAWAVTRERGSCLLYFTHTRTKNTARTHPPLELDQSHESEDEHNNSSGAQSTQHAEDDAKLVLPAA